MKLTKSQRLFIKAGQIAEQIRCWKRDLWLHAHVKGNGFDTHDSWGYAYGIRKKKKRYKKLLREATEAAILEREGIYGEGLADAFKSHLE